MSTVVFEGTPPDGGETADSAADPSLVEVDPGHYQFEAVVARGGAGVVLKARDCRLRRPVAVKQNLRGHGTMQARFEREAWLTARLQHPGIVPIYEAGRWPNGESFYAMRLVAGRPLSEVIAGCGSLDERLALLPKVVAVSEAVAYAHTQRVLHRDLKPHNVMIGPFGDVVVIDWGLAKDLAQPDVGASSDGEWDAGSVGETVAGSVIGTPAYMPPEQARGQPVDQRADVYALGALLYHVLTGAPPFDGASNTEILGRVLNDGPQPVEQRQPGVPRDLAAVIKKAMARDPAARYADAGELCDELQRFVTGQLVRAHQYSRAVLVRRAIKRHPLAAAVGVFALVLALLGAVAVRRIVVEKEAAESRGRELLLGQARALLETDPTASVALLKRYPDRAGESEAVRAIALDAESRGVARHVLSAHTSDVRDVAFSPDGAELASAGADGALHLWNVATGASRRIHTSNNAITNVLYDPRGAYLAASLGPLPGMLLWDRRAGTSRRLALDSDVYIIAFSPDGALLAGGDIGGTVHLWSVTDGKARTLTGHTDWIESVEFAPDGKSLLSASQDGTARLWNVASGESQVLALDGQGYVGVFSRDGRRAAVGCENGSVHLYSIDGAAQPVRVVRADPAAVDYIAFSPDGAHLAWAGLSRDVHVLDLRSNELTALHGHEDDVGGMTFLPDGTLVTASADGTLRRWDLASRLGTALRGHTDHIQAMAVSADGRRVASGGADRTVRVWELEPAPRTHGVHVSKEGEIRAPRGNDLLYFRPDGGGLGVLDLRSGRGQTIETRRQWARYTGDPNGRHLAYRDLLRKVSIVDLAGGTERDLSPDIELVGAAMEFSPDGATLAFPGWTGVRLVDVNTLRLSKRELPYPSGRLTQEGMKYNKLQYSDDGRELLGVRGRTEVGEIVVWNVASAVATVIPPLKPQAPSSVFASRDLGALAAGAVGGLWLFERKVGRWRQLASTEGDVFPAAFSDDGTRLAAADDRGVLRVWRVSDGALLHLLAGHQGPIRKLEFAADGRRLISAGVDGAARVWDVETGQQLRAIRAHGGREVTWAGFRGNDLVTAGRDGTVRVWSPPEQRPGPVRALLDRLTSLHSDL